MSAKRPTPQELYEEGSTRDHARLSASAAHRLRICPGSAAAQEGVPALQSEACDRGTACHSLLEWGLCSCFDAGQLRFVDATVCGEKIGPWPIAELEGPVNDAIEWVWGLYSSMLDPEVYIEFEARELEKLDPDAGGIGDLKIIDHMTQVVYYLDYKSGYMFVDPKENYQLGWYELGSPPPPGYKVFYGVLQPLRWGEHGPVMWERDADWLELVAEEIPAIGKASRLEDPPRQYDEKGCALCRDGACKTRNTAMMGVIPYELHPPAAPQLCTPAMIGAILRKEEEVKKWFSRVREHAFALAQSGVDEGLGFKIVEGKGRSAWNPDASPEEEEALVEALQKKGVQPYKRALIGITEARKALGKKGSDLVDAMVHSLPGKPKLVPVSDTRQAIDSSGFDDIEISE